MEKEKDGRKGRSFVGGYISDEHRRKVDEVRTFLALRETYRKPTVTDALSFIIESFDANLIASQ